MKVKVFPGKLQGEISAPASKSATHRAFILSALASGKSCIQDFLVSDDTLATLKALEDLGVEVARKEKSVIIKGASGNFKPLKKELNFNLSGTSLRLFLGLASLVEEEMVLTGEKQLCKRPVKDLAEALSSLGVKIKYLSKEGYPPVKVKGGRLEGGEVEISGKISSQYISSLLIIAPFFKKGLRIKIKDKLRSKPYVDLTIYLMRKFGVEVEVVEDGKVYFVKPGQKYKAINYKVEGDYSSAGYFFAGAAITQGKVKVLNLNPESPQADRIFLKLLEKMGCKVKVGEQEVLVEGGLKLKGIEVDLGNAPDLVQTFAIVASCAEGKSRIKNIGHLVYKETNRKKALITELSKMGIKAEDKGEEIIIEGGVLQGAEIDTYSDHRMAMSFAIAGLRAKGGVVIKQAEVVSKSYPNFFKDLAKLNVKIEYLEDE